MALHQRLGIEHPILQAPMAGAQDSRMAIAVARAGGLGALPCAMLPPEAMTAELGRIRAATTAPINVNFFTHTPRHPNPAAMRRWHEMLRPYYEELDLDPDDVPAGVGRRPFDSEACDALEPFQPEVVSFHFGLPAEDLLARVRSWSSLVVSSATTVPEARWLAAHGADAIIAQGWEAGGHRGHFLSDDLALQMGTFALVPQIRAAVDLPIIAAGGITGPASVAAAIALGAEAVQVGTALLCCQESLISDVHRRALLGHQARPTAVTNLYTGRPARGIVTRLMRELGPLNPHTPPFPLAAHAIAPLRAAAEARGSGDLSPLWCGQNPGGCTEGPVADVVRELARGFSAARRTGLSDALELE